MPNRAIIVGIQAYPELPPALQGPKNDAKKFFEWVTTRGGVAVTDAHLILDDDPPAATAVNAHPTAEVIKYLFDLLEEEATHSPNGRAGNRLYLYLSGHGFGQSLTDASLLMANATKSRTRHHIPGRPWADHFFANGYFREVLLFLDCCRERYSTTTLNGPGTTIPAVPPPGAQCFYGFAAKYGKLAVERVIDGQMSGVFTATLLDALKGGAAEEDGRITGETLKAYLYENMKAFLSPADLADKDIAKEPDLYCEPPEDQFVIANVQPTKFNVTIPLPAGSEASDRQLFGEANGKKYTKIDRRSADGTLEWKLPLLRGTYQLIVNGDSWVVTVKGRGITDVAKP
jgi:Caspase domain